MPLILTYLFAAAGAWCLFDPPSLGWPLPALVIALFAHITRSIRAATWVLLVFSALLAVWSGHEFYRSRDPEEMGIFILGFTPWFQLGVIVLVLGPLLSSVCWFFGAPRPNQAPQRTESGLEAASDHDA